MSETEFSLRKPHVENALRWFQSHFRQSIVAPIETQFGGWPFTREIQDILRRIEVSVQIIEGWPDDAISLTALLAKMAGEDPLLGSLFKSIILLYRRYRAAETERLMERTFHPELSQTLEAEVRSLDRLTNEEDFSRIEPVRLPRLKDFLPVQHIESSTLKQIVLQPRQYDEKFHILQSPHLFLSDLGYFREKCEYRETPIALAFVDIDDFKSLNRHTETKVDRNVLPRFMQTIEAHVYHHGYAYRQGGDEYLILLPSLSRPIAIGFLDELRCKLASLTYLEIEEKTTVSIGLCIADSENHLTDRELLERANRAKQFAKQSGKNRIATYRGPRFISEELEVVGAPAS